MVDFGELAIECPGWLDQQLPPLACAVGGVLEGDEAVGEDFGEDAIAVVAVSDADGIDAGTNL